MYIDGKSLSTRIRECVAEHGRWSPDLLKEWAEERAAGVQYETPYGVVRCPLRWWETKSL